ncbi:MAG TPA: hypothetical protein VFV94_00335 [Polyangiaceae bacterium]|nr:hypothetical protein [Polyangiaceae bacterium]
MRGPLLLFAIYGAARSLAEFFPPTDVVPKAPRFIAAFAWCAALVRMGFALFSSRYVTRFVRPWPKVMRVVVQAVIYFGVTLVALRAASRATPSKEFGSFSRISAASLDGHHTSIHIHVWLTR